MPLHHAVLALLSAKPAHGYELKTSFEQAVGDQWGGLNIGHLYQILDRLSRNGLIDSQRQPQQVKPDRVIHRLTPAGRAELERWLAEPAIAARGYRDDFFLKIMAAVRSAEGDHRAALAAAEQAFAIRESLGIAAQDVKLGFLHALEAARALGDQAKTNELLEIVEVLPAGLRPPFLEATAHRFRAHLAGDDPGADRHYTTAAAQLRTHELPFHLAVAQLEHAEWLLARGRPDDAQALLAEARDTFERLEAKPWLERVDSVSPGTQAEIGV